jgi:hypothetical protein
MNSSNIPMNAYIFIGVASLVLAFVTILDNQPDESKEIPEEPETSFTEYLPSFDGNNGSAATEPIQEMAEPSEYKAPPPAQVAEPVIEPVTQPQSYDMFNANLNSDQGLVKNEYQAPPQPIAPPAAPPAAPQVAQPVVQQPVQPQQTYDVFNTNLNSDQGLAQNENIGLANQPVKPQAAQPPLPMVTNPLYGGKNKTGKKIDKKGKKKTRCNKGK